MHPVEWLNYHHLFYFWTVVKEGSVSKAALSLHVAQPTVVRKEICRRYHVAWVGELDHVREKFYAISVERRITHPAVRLMADQAERRLFS
jgi:hypothetical protein